VSAGAALRLAALCYLAYVLPGDRVVGMIAESRSAHSPILVEAKLSTRESSAPTHLAIELHPDLGERVADDRGGRWILAAAGRPLVGSRLPAPAWLPDLAPLALRQEGELRDWLAANGVDLGQNELAQCGDDDCWVIGTRQAPAQLWIEKSQFELRRLVRPKQPRVAFDQWQQFGKIRFPARIEIADDSGVIATLAVESVAPTNLAAADFSPTWVQVPASPKR
jgi:hypothetical protein